MIQQLYDNYIFIYGMAGLCVLGTLLKIMVSRTYKRLIKASDNMGSTNHKLMKLMKMKFEAYYKLKIGVNNVDSFVDKYVYRHRICGIHLYTWENIGGQLLILCLLAGTVGSVLGLAYDCGKNDILVTFFTGVFTSSLLIVVESFINLGAKKSILKANITDYLENFLKVRLEQENFTPETLEEYRQEYFNNTLKKDSKRDNKKEVKKDVKKEAKKEEKQSLTSVIEDKDTKNQRIADPLKSEEALKLAREKEREKSKKERDKEMLLREKELNIRQSKMQQVDLQPTYPVKGDGGEDMRFLIKNLADTAASKEGSPEEQEQIMPKEKIDTKKEVEHKSRTENDEKIIEDILKEFLA
ncbi:hypothetical protein [Anaerosporobacter sp.]